MIQIEDVSLTIKNKQILQDIDVEFPENSVIGLVGRNGCGKTMLMKCICGFVRVSTGTITVNEKIVGSDVDFPEDMGVIIETPAFIPYYSGFRNLKMLAEFRKKVSPKRIKAVMERVGLNPELKLPVSKYSLGMRQRLGIAQAVMEKPSLLVLDEPFNGIDVDGLEQMREIILTIKKRGATIILASHNQDDINQLCDYIYFMEKGRIVSSQSHDEYTSAVPL